MRPDRSHVHHRLIDMGLSQKQTVGILYVISTILGLSAVVLTTSGATKAFVLLLSMAAAGAVAWHIYVGGSAEHKKKEEDSGKGPAARQEEPKPEWQEDDHA